MHCRNECLHCNIPRILSLIDHFSLSIGGLFENGDETVEMAFRDAVERINSDETILPNTRLEAVIEKLERLDSFQASKRGKH